MAAHSARWQSIASGLFRAASAWNVSMDLASPCESGPDESLYNSLPHVNQVDIFISHSWDCPSWMKFLALCQYLNFDMAVALATFVWISTALILLFRAGGIVHLADSMVGSSYLTYALVYWPMTVFCLVYFFGHTLCRKTFWFDRICVSQVNPELKAEALDALPHFVANSKQMLILLDDNYLERLWCNYEIAVFSTTSPDPNSMHFMPLWLPIWTLSTLALDCLGVLAITFYLPATATDPPTKVTDSRVTFFILTLATWTGPGVVYACSVILSFLVHSRRLQFHNLLLERMASFDFRNAKCKLESDRSLIEAQLLQLFDEALEPPLVVAIDVAELGEPSSAPLISEEEMKAIRPITSYPSEEEVLQLFNAYVRGPMRERLLNAIGSEVDIPWKLCAVSFLPLIFDALAVTFSCEGAPCFISAKREGYASTTLYILSNFLGFAIECWLGLPTIHPIMLRVLRAIRTNVSHHVLKIVLGAVCSVGVYVYVFVSTAAVIGFVMVSITRFSGTWCLASILGFTLLTMQASALFLNRLKLPKSCRSLNSSEGWKGTKKNLPPLPPGLPPNLRLPSPPSSPRGWRLPEKMGWCCRCLALGKGNVWGIFRFYLLVFRGVFDVYHIYEMKSTTHLW